MFNLVWQSFYLQWKSSLLFLAVLVLAFFIFFNIWEQDIIFILAIFLALNLSFRSAQLDGEKGGLSFLTILPLGREHIVISKFLVSFVAILLSYGLGVLGSLLLYGWDLPFEHLLFMGQFFSVLLLLKGVFWMYFFKDDYAKARDNIRLVVLVPLFFLLFYDVEAGQFGGQVIGILGAFYFLLMLPSIRFFNMKDLV